MVVRTYEDLSIAEAAQQAGFSVLIEAAKKADLYDTLENAQNITVFAPDDNAFNAIEKFILEGLLKLENKEKLAEILKFHIVSSEMPSEAVKAVDEIEMLSGHSSCIVQKNGDLYICDAKITQPDIRTKNGIIHAIDKVLMPE